jgi:hypothetical protein
MMNEDAARTLLLLEEQYTVTEAYANAQTQLWNITQHQHQPSSQGILDDTTTTTERHSLISTAVQLHYDALRSVQDNLKQQLQFQHKNQRLEQHLELTQRVLQTLAVYPCSWHANGVPLSSSSSQQQQQQQQTSSSPSGGGIVVTNNSTTVAMAALRASISQVLEHYQQQQ